MKKTNSFSAKAVIAHASICILLIIGIISCDYNKKLGMEVTPSLNITGYLEDNKGTFSELLKLMDRTVTISNGESIRYGSFLAAYGTYTMFAPTNESLLNYIHAKKGANATVDNLSNDEVRDLLNFHILQDTISTTSFNDGKLDVPTMYGQYMVTGNIYNEETGVTHIRINKQANIIEKNIKLGNGILHIIDGVLEPAMQTTASMIENDPRFTIFTQALKETGYYDSLNVVSNNVSISSKRWLSVMATSDAVYNSIGIPDYTTLRATYCKTNDPKDPKDSLHLYVGYHILDGLKFTADLLATKSYSTLTPNQVISISKNLDTVLINEFFINNKLEKGTALLRYQSDNSSSNGVWHILGGDYYIKVRKIEAVYWDVCDYSKLRSIGSVPWGTPGAGTVNNWLTSGQLPEITYNSNGGVNTVGYSTNGIIPFSNNSRYAVNYNYMWIYFRNTSAVKWIKLATPFIAAGRYKVWLNHIEYGSGKVINIQATVGTGNDSTDLPVIINLADYLPSRGTATLEEWDNSMQAIGYKRPMQMKGATGFSDNRMVGKYMGAVTFNTSSTHWIKFTALTNGSSNVFNAIDMIHFIPFDQDQIWPKFDQDGTAWPRPPSPYDDKAAAIY